MSTNVVNATTSGQLVDPGRHYAHAPISEAVLDIHVPPTENLAIQDLLRVYVGEEAAYPVKKTPMILQWQVTGGPETVASATTQTQTGFAFVSADQSRVFQARRDGFSFNKLKPYDRWESFRDEAQRLWNKYRAVVNPATVRMLSLRYVNLIDLPNPSELKDYFRVFPEIAGELPQELNTFALQVSIPMRDIGAVLLMNQASAPSPSPETALILLDLQLFVQLDKTISEKAIWRFFEQFRIRKNQIFEACITDRLRERIR